MHYLLNILPLIFQILLLISLSLRWQSLNVLCNSLKFFFIKSSAPFITISTFSSCQIRVLDFTGIFATGTCNHFPIYIYMHVHMYYNY